MPVSIFTRWPWLTAWVVTALALLIINAPIIASLGFRDPDDALRLVEVRNWLAGQGWFDVSQPRINPPFGGDMHWSRFVDVPIAALMVLFGLFMADSEAGRWAATVLPLLYLASYFALIQSILSALRPRDMLFVWAGLGIAATSMFTLQQFAPLRIDHHGVQLLLSLALLRIALARPTLKLGMLAGALLSLHLAISLEGLPYLALFGVLAGIAYLRHAEGWPRLQGLAWSLAISSFALSLAGRGWSSLFVRHCDAVSQPHIVAFAATAAMLITLGRAIGHATVLRRVIVAGLAASAGAALLLLLAADCIIDPFGTLDPLVYEHWYRQISEGRPIWAQAPGTVAGILVQSLLGLAGAVIAFLTARRSGDADAARRWAIALLLGGGAFVLSSWVARAMYTAHAFAVPGVAVLLVLAWQRARTLSGTATRILASVGVAVVLPVIATPLFAALIGGTTGHHAADEQVVITDPATRLTTCRSPASLAPLNRIAPATIFAPLDLGPAVLVATRHSVVATSHHRNDTAIAKVITGFSASPAQAESIVRNTGARWMLVCPGIGEQALYTARVPGSLIAMIENGRHPGWLIPAYAGNGLVLYRITPAKVRPPE